MTLSRQELQMLTPITRAVCLWARGICKSLLWVMDRQNGILANS